MKGGRERACRYILLRGGVELLIHSSILAPVDGDWKSPIYHRVLCVWRKLAFPQLPV